MSPTEPIPPSSLPPQVPPPPPEEKSRAWLWILLAVIIFIIIVAVVTFLVVRNRPATDPGVGPSGSVTLPTTSPTPTASAAGFVSDTALRNATIPARAGDLHGCLASATTLTNGQGSGSGVVGNGSATPVTVVAVGNPLVGRFTEGGETVKIYALYCYETGTSISDGVMIDMAVLDSTGAVVPMVPPDVFDVVVQSMAASVPDYFPTFDSGSLKLSSVGGSVTYGGLTAKTQYSGNENFEFKLVPTMSTTSKSISLTATSTPT